MDLLAAYKDDGHDNDEAEEAVEIHESTQTSSNGEAPKPVDPKLALSVVQKLRSINPAPAVSIDPTRSQEEFFQDPTDKVVYHNPKYDSLWTPIAGPINPLVKDGLAAGQKNVLTGFVEELHVHDFVFDEQYHTFHNLGYAADPSGAASEFGDEKYVMNPAKSRLEERKGGTVYNSKAKIEKKRKLPKGDPSTEDYLGPWAPYEGDEREAPAELTEEQKEYIEMKRKKDKKGNEAVEAKTIFHGDQLHDYKGRTYIHPPSDLKPHPAEESFIPKTWVHTWTGHTAGVSAIRFFPKYGHLLLSSSMDTKCKIWDVYNSKKCLRTFMGHSKAVRDICFSNDGRRFLSASYDRHIKLWDTETGQAIGSFTNGKIPYCVKFNPDDDKQHLFVVGGSDKKIVQWDINSNEVVQEYDQHLGAVNTVTFIDGNRRFVSSSDDKSIRVWEWGIPVVIKYISEPHMHSMPAIEVHPNGNWFIGQSLDNQILVYSTRDRFKLNKKKRFMGHLVAGYACQLGFSPDGRFVMSGDGEGKVWFWDWKSSKVYRTLKCHDGVSIGCEWHPVEASKVATCGWDGTIKYWD